MRLLITFRKENEDFAKSYGDGTGIFRRMPKALTSQKRYHKVQTQRPHERHVLQESSSNTLNTHPDIPSSSQAYAKSTNTENTSTEEASRSADVQHMPSPPAQERSCTVPSTASQHIPNEIIPLSSQQVQQPEEDTTVAISAPRKQGLQRVMKRKVVSKGTLQRPAKSKRVCNIYLV